MLPIEPETLLAEITQVRDYVNQLLEKVENGVPGDDLPATGENQEIWLLRMRRGLMLAGARMMALAEVIEE